MISLLTDKIWLQFLLKVNSVNVFFRHDIIPLNSNLLFFTAVDFVNLSICCRLFVGTRDACSENVS